jgi:hypothetical protein
MTRWRRRLGVFGVEDLVTRSARTTHRLVAFKLSQGRTATGLVKGDLTADLIDFAAVLLECFRVQSMGGIRGRYLWCGLGLR